MNEYEKGTLLDLLCKKGFFCQQEEEDFQLKFLRICKNKLLFDSKFWKNDSNFQKFIIDFATLRRKNLIYAI
jgi:hypothetical protein